MVQRTSPCPRTSARLRAAALALAVVALGAGCHRSRGPSTTPNATSSPLDLRDVRCVERPEGCVYCEGRGPTAPLVDPDALPASLCDPKDRGGCVDFCTTLAPDCAVPWRSGPSCLSPSEAEFRREIFRRDTADRPEAIVQGRVSDEAGHRLESAKITVWFQGTIIFEDASAKDGGFRLKLPAGQPGYVLRVSHAGFATELSDLRLDRAGAVVRSLRLSAEVVVRGRVSDAAGTAVAGVTVHALRNADDPIEVAEALTAEDGTFTLSGLESKRYTLRASKFGWLPVTLKNPVTVPGPRVSFKLVQTGVIRGRVLDEDGDGQPGATVVALPSGGLGAESPVIWTVDTNGGFAQDRFAPGTYYVWARYGEMLLYPPEKLEIAPDDLDSELELKLSHKGARVRGRVVTSSGGALDSEARAVLLGLSPLALPRKAIGEIDREGKFIVSGLLPGRYEISVRVGARILPIVSGARDVEVPIEPGVDVDLPDPVTVRPQAEE